MIGPGGTHEATIWRVGGGGDCPALLCGVLTGCEAPYQWPIELVSRGESGAGNGHSLGPVFSPDGTEIAFTSCAAGFGPRDSARPLIILPGGGEAGSNRDVYLRDLTAGTNRLISAVPAGDDSGNGRSHSPVFSPDGTKIAFVSWATNLAPGVTVPETDTPVVYVRDLVANTTVLASTTATGAAFSVTDPQVAGWSPDSTRLALTTLEHDLGPADANGAGDVYVKDLGNGALTLVSANAAGTSTANRGSRQPAFHPDGTKVLFISSADDEDLYLRDLTTGAVTLVSANAAGTDSGNGDSWQHAGFSPDGTKVLFTSDASDLGPHDTNNRADVYRRDLARGTTSLVSINAAGTDSGAFGSSDPLFSPDGTKVVFDSLAGDLIPGRSGLSQASNVRDLVTGKTIRLGGGGGLIGGPPAFSPDSRRVAYPKPGTWTNLYVLDLATGSETLVSRKADGEPASGGASSPVFGSNGTLAFLSGSWDLDADMRGSDVAHQQTDIYLVRPAGADLVLTADAAPDPYPHGAEVTFRFHVVNVGPDEADDARLAVAFSEPVTVTGIAPSQGTCAEPPQPTADLLTCELGDLVRDGTADVALTVAGNPGGVLALGHVSSDTPDPSTAMNLAWPNSREAG